MLFYFVNNVDSNKKVPARFVNFPDKFPGSGAAGAAGVQRQDVQPCTATRCGESGKSDPVLVQY